MAALDAAAKAAPGPLSALAAAITTFSARTLASRRLAFALIAEPVEPEVDAARASYARTLVAEFEALIRKAAAGGHLPGQEAPRSPRRRWSARWIELLIGPLAPAAGSDRSRRVRRCRRSRCLRCAGLAWSMRAPAVWSVQTVVPEAGSAPPRA